MKRKVGAVPAFLLPAIYRSTWLTLEKQKRQLEGWRFFLPVQLN
ncbi:hypothetical protein [Vibrio fortis]|nr:hypothetical protein [Vibrio fortis]